MLCAGIAGLGWWGRTIVATLNDSQTMRVVAATDLDPATAIPGLAFVPDFHALLTDNAIDAVILCTPHPCHAQQILATAHAGKHVFCEKPLCLTRAEAAAAIAACAEAGVTLGVGHERRFEPPILALQELVRSGALGTPLQIEANFSQDKFLLLEPGNWRLSPIEAPAGPMTATGIHLLDLAVSFLGPAESVLSRLRQPGHFLANGDGLALLVTFASGANALISAILATPFDGRFAIYGSQGWAELRDRAHPEASEGWTLTISRRGHGREVHDFAPANAVRANLDAFAMAALGGASYPVSPQAMLGTVAVMEAAIRSAANGRIEPVDPP